MRKGKHHDHNHLVPHQGDPTDLAARLTPPEEAQSRGSNNNGGAIVVDAAALKLPKDFTEREDKSGRWLGLEPITAFLLVFSLAFISLIAYLISIEPPRPETTPKATVEIER